MSLYANYVRERENQNIIETEKGFATYELKENGDCYLRDIYVLPEFRKDGIARTMSEQVEQVAIEKGCVRMVGSVCIDTNNSTESLKAILAVGYKLFSIQGNMIFLVKEIRRQQNG